MAPNYTQGCPLASTYILCTCVCTCVCTPVCLHTHTYTKRRKPKTMKMSKEIKSHLHVNMSVVCLDNHVLGTMGQPSYLLSTHLPVTQMSFSVVPSPLPTMNTRACSSGTASPLQPLGAAMPYHLFICVTFCPGAAASFCSLCCLTLASLLQSIGSQRTIQGDHATLDDVSCIISERSHPIDIPPPHCLTPVIPFTNHQERQTFQPQAPSVTP